ncbi:arginine--tRNA ligase, cytoplasmic-like [Papaver somniferum]|uniref:arginine--tRNA ligase, cytoplasmic-like n=1 Tax=Papaver somniferum TaxID=3469 RepID=UPI000E6FB738|nr:arginine--tRNA ligase, cytoplasmic-like [Papaver somniferum]XP_026423329.1 arginine--tRNA ligase, cytoplasmic-like [Papaver somniferum]
MLPVEAKKWSGEVADKIAETISIGALKYADLKNDRDNSYKFNLDEMLSKQGNSAYSIQSAHACISGLISSHGKASLEQAKGSDVRIVLLEEAELTLGRHLASFTQVVENACLALKPHFICDYFTRFDSNFLPLAILAQYLMKEERLTVAGCCCVKQPIKYLNSVSIC